MKTLAKRWWDLRFYLWRIYNYLKVKFKKVMKKPPYCFTKQGVYKLIKVEELYQGTKEP